MSEVKKSNLPNPIGNFEEALRLKVGEALIATPTDQLKKFSLVVDHLTFGVTLETAICPDPKETLLLQGQIRGFASLREMLDDAVEQKLLEAEKQKQKGIKNVIS